MRAQVMNSSVPANQVLGSLGLGPQLSAAPLSSLGPWLLPLRPRALECPSGPVATASNSERAAEFGNEASFFSLEHRRTFRAFRRREKLVGGPGELEYAFFFQPAKAGREDPQSKGLLSACPLSLSALSLLNYSKRGLMARRMWTSCCTSVLVYFHLEIY